MCHILSLSYPLSASHDKKTGMYYATTSGEVYISFTQVTAYFGHSKYVLHRKILLSFIPLQTVLL